MDEESRFFPSFDGEERIMFKIQRYIWCARIWFRTCTHSDDRTSARNKIRKMGATHDALTLCPFGGRSRLCGPDRQEREAALTPGPASAAAAAGRD